MTSSVRIGIIGAGVAGCGAARRAAELGAKEVILVEKNTPASASSGRSAGVYNAQTLNPMDIEIRVREREMLFRLEKEGKLHLARIGNLRICRSEDDMRKVGKALDFQHQLGVRDARIIEAGELKRLVPALECSDLAGALFGPNDGHLDGYQLCNALVDEARAMGARVLTQAEVTSCDRHGSAHVLHTQKGDIECDVVINAAGAWADRVGKMLGHPANVKPEVHEVIRVKLPRRLSYTVPMCNFYMPGSAGEAVYFRQDGPDSLIAGLHTYDHVDGLEVTDFDAFSPHDSDDYFVQVATQVNERLKIDDLGFRAGWFGLYPLSADGVFQVGPYKADNSVLTVAGLGGVGVTSGAVLGALAAEWAILGKPVTVPGAAALLPDRQGLAA